MNKLYRVTIGGLSMLLTAAQCHAAGIDLSTLTTAVDLSTVTTAIVAVGALLMVPSIAMFAVRKLLHFFWDF